MAVIKNEPIKNKDLDVMLSDKFRQLVSFYDCMVFITLGLTIISVFISPLMSIVPVFAMWHFSKMVMLQKIEGEILSPEFASIIRTKMLMKHKK